MNDLVKYRKQIDTLDDKIVNLLAQRFEIVDLVIQYKIKNDIDIRLEDRIFEVIERNEYRASQIGLPDELVSNLYIKIVEATCRYEVANFHLEPSP